MKESNQKELLRITETDLFDDASARSRINDGWHTLHRLMRGKYVAMFVLAPLVAILGGVYGWKHGQQSYASTGIIRVIPVLPHVMANDDEHGVMPMFDSFAETQASLVQSRGVIDAALRQPAWVRLKGPPTDGDVLAFMHALLVERKQELIYVKYTDANPDVCLAGVNVLVSEYEKLNADLDARTDERRISLLKQMQDSLTRQAADLDSQILHLNDSVGADNLQALYESKIAYIRELDAKIQESELEQAQYGDVGIRAKTLRDRADALTLIREKTHDELSTIGKQKDRMAELRRQADAIRAQADEVRQRIDRLTVESPASGRIEIVGKGERPISPEKDSRISRAALGVLGGGASVVSLLLLIGLFDSRIRLPDDLPSKLRHATLLGMLPRLPKNSDNPFRAAAAAHCVQQIRTMVQLWCGTRDKKVVTVTSSGSGSGKTTLTMALGVSCAASGCKTLLVDCDLVGAELSRSFRANVRRKLGSILRREKLISEEQLNKALDRGREFNMRLGEVLVEGGILKTADIERCLAEQQRHELGLLDVLASEPLEDCVMATTVGNLDVLPVGLATPSHAAMLSQASLKNLLTSARQRYDMILIDTGPMPGSIEGAVVTAVSDGVILAVTSGEKRAMVSRTLEVLNTLSCEIIGVVFNRVRRHEETQLSSSQRSTEAVVTDDSNALVSLDARVANTAHYGPIERAVMASVPDRMRSDLY